MADNETVHKERVLIDESVMGIYRDLRADANTQVEQSPFASFKDIFMLAACLGFQNGRRSKLPSGSKSDIRESVFLEADMAVLKAIAIADTGDVTILAKPGEILRIAEEYAHSGILEVKAYLQDERGLPLWNLVSLM
jgi:dnd system-associated protein 4